jgi:hypothetical protein
MGIGYDVMAYVGLQRFLHHRQREEIRLSLLHEHGISISAGMISNLAKLFLGYMRELHNGHADQFQIALAGDGGWPLHIDATGEDGRGTLLVAFSGWRKWVLGSWKIPTENVDAILPCLQEVVSRFGSPCSVMRDLGRKLGTEINEAREELTVWQEQTGGDHRIPEGRSGIAIVRALTQRVLDFKADGTGHDYPFDRPFLDLYDRCKEARRAIDAFLYRTPSDPNVLKYLIRLHRILGPLESEVPFKQAVRRLQSRAKLLDELRDALRFSPGKSITGNEMNFKENTTQDLSATKLRDIQKQVKDLESSLKESRPKRGPAKDSRSAIELILRHFKNHGDYLWGHVINLSDHADGDIRLVDRTNNILERFFRGMKQKERRRSGRKILTQDFEHLPPEAALVYNLKCADYVSIVCGSLDQLHEAFSQIDRKRVRKNGEVQSRIDYYSNLEVSRIETASLPTKDRRLIRTDQMQRRIAAAAKSRAPIYAP